MSLLATRTRGAPSVIAAQVLGFLRGVGGSQLVCSFAAVSNSVISAA